MNSSLILVLFSLLTWGVGEGMFFIFQPIYLQQLGANTMTIAGIFSAFGAAMMLAHIPAGYLADRIGRRPLLIAAWCSGLIATWIMALARSLPVFVAGMLVYGLTAFVSSPLNSYVTAARGRLSPGRVMTISSAAFNLGAVVGPLLGGVLGDRFSLRSVYLVSAALFVLSAFLLLFTRSQPLESHDPATPPARLFKNSRFLSFLGLIFVVMFVMYLPQPLTARFLQNERGLSLSAVGLLGSVSSLGNTVMNLVLGLLPAGIGFLLAQLSTGMFTLLIWRGSGVFWYGLGYFLLGGYRASRPLYFAQVRTLIHGSQMGLAYGMAETVNSLTTILAPLLAGALYTQDPERVFPVSLGLILAALLVTLLYTARQPAWGLPSVKVSPDA